MAGSDQIRELRVLVSSEGVLRRLCRFAFTNRDASIYLMAHATAGRYFYGDETLEEHAASRTFPYTEQLSSDAVPKVSIHERGQVHVYADGASRAGPLQIPALPRLRGQHVASVVVDTFAGLARFKGRPRASGRERDLIIEVEPGALSGRLAVYVNGSEPRFANAEIQFHVSLSRITSPSLSTSGWPPSPSCPPWECATRTA